MVRGALLDDFLPASTQSRRSVKLYFSSSNAKIILTNINIFKCRFADLQDILQNLPATSVLGYLNVFKTHLS